MSLKTPSMKIIEVVNNNPHKAIEIYNEKLIRELLEKADEAYHEEGAPIFSDAVYDVLRDAYPREDVGAAVSDGQGKVQLPYWLGSMDKRHGGVALKEPLVISDKLDGVSGLLVVSQNGAQLLTRGNGSVGRDISGIIPHLNLKVPKRPMVIRGELVMKRSVFATLRNGESNARNTVAGFANSKRETKGLRKKIDFVSYEVLEPPDMKPSKQMEFLKKQKMNPVRFEVVQEASDEHLSGLLHERDASSEYDMDGLIVARDVEYVPVTKKNPKHAFAFKLNVMEQESGETDVTKVEWRISKDGLLKPTVHMKPLNLKGVVIQKATGHNARFVVDQGLGVGARIRIIRSGDVIPRIVQVVAKTSPAMPEVAYAWSDTKVDLISKSNDDTELKKKRLVYTLSKLSFDNMGEKTVHLLYDHGFDTLGKILTLSKQQVLSVDKLKGKMGENLLASIQKRKEELRCIDYAVASNAFGRGFSTSTLNTIDKVYPLMTGKPTLDGLKAIDGIGEITAKNYMEGLPNFKQYVTKNGLESTCTAAASTSRAPQESPPVRKSNLMEGRVVLITGFRDADFEKQMVEAGATMSKTMSKKVNTLVFADGKEAKSKGKIDAAKERGDVRVMSRSELERLIGS